jgi:hypothetical protein
MTWGFDDALSLIVTVPDFSPFDLGEKVTLMVQLSAGATADPQVEFMPNWPVVFIEEIFSSVLPVLVRVTIWGWLVVPADCFLNTSGVVGEKTTTPVFNKITISSV